MMYRNNLGSVQPIRLGEVNWMTAGRRIVHSERTSDEGNQDGTLLSGVQTWVALPKAYEETEPAFAHHCADQVPGIDGDGIKAKVILGKLFGRRSPVVTLGEPTYADCRLDPSARLVIPTNEMEECGACLISGSLLVGEQRFTPGVMVVFKPGAEVIVTTDEPTRLMLVGGTRVDGARYIWWNFVSSSMERIEMAKADWRDRKLPGVPGDDQFTPLPE
jgi:redox-sensitive bicupin YhaK (pirin superfamily)